MTNIISQPEIPSAFRSLEDAVIAAMFCQSLGFDSELADTICKDYGCSIEMLKDIAQWHLQQKQARDLEHQNELKALQDKHSELSNLAEKQAIELAQVKEALAEFGMGTLAIKAEQKQAIKAIEQEHKKAINILGKEQKKRVKALKKEHQKDQYKLELAKRVEAVLRSVSAQKHHNS
ncbi:hypothetical protein [Anaerobiospirillum succiniciproducens]|uniref:hypothetical protein n=1 Tax=Anaerobiospirillum succiniciproducens TaxID=13335 RepID=UPI002943B49F|nr:hypothetical protein [Anaerobiospirillum succiniciproducens]